MSQQSVVRKRIRKLRQEIENLIDYLDLLEARAHNLGKPGYTSAQAKKLLKLK
jgi:hypothetical protein